MSKTTYAGIDYAGRNSTSNRNPETGIRYGVISQNSIHPDAMSDVWDNSEDLTYAACVVELKQRLAGALALEMADEKREALERALSDWCHDLDDDTLSELCESDNVEKAWSVIEQDFNDSYCSDEHSWRYESDGVVLENCLSNDVFVLNSKFFTFAQFCSPCVPGACNLDSPLDIESLTDDFNPDTKKADPAWTRQAHANKCYCLGHDYFENGTAPYSVFSVETGEMVMPQPQ